MHLLDIDGSILVDINAHQVVVWVGAVALAHRVESEEIDHVVEALIPLVYMTAEHYRCVPFVELLEQEVGFLAREGRGKLETLRQEDVGVAEDESVAVMPLAVEHTSLDKVDL